MMKTGFIYCITCLPTGKLYFGQTMRSIKRRFEAHKREAIREPDCKFHRAIQKYGEANFIVEEVMFVEAPTKKELKRKLDYFECYFISRYDTKKHGYNSTDGGEPSPMLGRKHSDETRKKIGKAALGRKLSIKTKRKISQGNRGKKYTKETCQKISEAKMGYPSPMKGKHHSEESKRKMRESRLRKKLISQL